MNKEQKKVVRDFLNATGINDSDFNGEISKMDFIKAVIANVKSFGFADVAYLYPWVGGDKPTTHIYDLKAPTHTGSDNIL